MFSNSMDAFSFFLSWPIQSKWSLYIWLKIFTTTPIIVMLGSISNLGYQYIHLTGFSSLLLALTWGMYRFFFFAVPSHSFFYAIKPLQNHSYRANPPEFFRWHWEIRTDTVQHPLTPSLDKKITEVKNQSSQWLKIFTCLESEGKTQVWFQLQPSDITLVSLLVPTSVFSELVISELWTT